MRIVNLTGAPVRLAGPSGRTLELPPEAAPASVKVALDQVGRLDGPAGTEVPILRQHPVGEPENLPPPAPGTVYVAPEAVAKAALAAGRLDVFAPVPAPDGAVRGLVEPW